MYHHLTSNERYYIWIRLSNYISISQIAKELCRSKSTISREISRNRDECGNYLPGTAELLSYKKRKNSKLNYKYARLDDKYKSYIVDKLNLSWSPEQISGRALKDIKRQVSHVTIYNYIYDDKILGGKLYKQLCRKKKYKYGFSANYKNKILDRIDISKRPKAANLRQDVGHWEADTIVNCRNSQKDGLLTVVDRKSLYTLVRKIENKSSLTVQKTFESIYDESILPFTTITTDNGTEFANHKLIKDSIGSCFYFARPYKSCDRGLNENTNGLIRRYLPKGTNLSQISRDKISEIQNLLNNRPRKRLNYLTPNEIMIRSLRKIYRQANSHFVPLQI